MTTIDKIIKENEEKFDGLMIDEYGKWKIGRVEAKQFLKDSQLRLLSAFKEMVESKRQIKSQKCTECGGKGLPTECMGGSDWLLKDAYNSALNDILSSLTQVDK